MIINTAGLSAVFTGFKKIFQNALKGAPSQWKTVATLVPSSTETNLYAWLGQFPQLREWVGDRVIKNMVSNNYSLPNKDFESTVGVKRTKILDDTYGTMSTIFAEMGAAAARHPDEIVFALLLIGTTELCYDGQPFFDADHPIVVDGVATTVSNYDSTSGGSGKLWVVMDTSRPLKPMIFQKREDYKFQTFKSDNDMHVFMRNEYLYGVDARVVPGFGLWQLAYGSINELTGDNFDLASSALRDLDSDEGKPLGIKPTHIVVGNSNRIRARDIFETEKLASGASNPNYKEVIVIDSPWME